jgi:hypothetical protein
MTPAANCLKFYNALLEKGISSELHIYAINEHGFDFGLGRGYSVSMWRENFIAWLRDMKIDNNFK